MLHISTLADPKGLTKIVYFSKVVYEENVGLGACPQKKVQS